MIVCSAFSEDAAIDWVSRNKPISASEGPFASTATHRIWNIRVGRSGLVPASPIHDDPHTDAASALLVRPTAAHTVARSANIDSQRAERDCPGKEFRDFRLLSSGAANHLYEDDHQTGQDRCQQQVEHELGSDQMPRLGSGGYGSVSDHLLVDDDPELIVEPGRDQGDRDG
jgi:hypothetical protein